MTAALTTLRATIATALDEPNSWSTFSYPPATIIANAVIVAPADPYVEPSNNKYATISPKANFKIIMTVPMFDNQGNLQGIETLAVAVFNKLAASNINLNVSALSAPSVLEAQSGSLLTADFTISVLTSWS